MPALLSYVDVQLFNSIVVLHVLYPSIYILLFIPPLGQACIHIAALLFFIDDHGGDDYLCKAITDR